MLLIAVVMRFVGVMPVDVKLEPLMVINVVFVTVLTAHNGD